MRLLLCLLSSVTKEEAAWESFSEDDVPAATRSKADTTPALPASAAGKKKSGAGAEAGGGKQGQGNIMSFFGKK